MKPCVRCATLNGFPDVAKSVDIDAARLLRGIGLTPSDLTVADKWVPAADTARLLDTSAALSGHDDFALRLAERRRLSTLGPLSVVLREEPNLRGVLDLLIRYERSYNEALHLSLSEDEGTATIRLWFEFGEPAPVQQALDLAVGALHGIIRTFVGSDWKPLSVCFAHRKPADVRTHERMFNSRLRFDHEFTGIVLRRSELDATNAMSDPQLRAYTERILNSLPPGRAADTVEQVKELVELLLPLNRCSMEHVARTLGVDVRTLRRHLAGRQESFSSIVHSTRARLAERYLPNERYSLTEISRLLGFAAPSAFTRWFHQQFGSSPGDWRRAAAQ